MCNYTGYRYDRFSALDKPVISVWGNIAPEFGMYPYIPQNKDLVHIIEVEGLSVVRAVK